MGTRKMLQGISTTFTLNNSAAFAENLSIVACGTADGLVWIWDFDKCGFEAKLEHNPGQDQAQDLLNKEQKVEISSMAFMHPYPLLCSADVRGQVIVWTVKPGLIRQ